MWDPSGQYNICRSQNTYTLDSEETQKCGGVYVYDMVNLSNSTYLIKKILSL